MAVYAWTSLAYLQTPATAGLAAGWVEAVNPITRIATEVKTIIFFISITSPIGDTDQDYNGKLNLWLAGFVIKCRH
jgi:hypothetical protein